MSTAQPSDRGKRGAGLIDKKTPHRSVRGFLPSTDSRRWEAPEGAERAQQIKNSTITRESQ